MSPADKRYLEVNRRRDKISRRYARELTEEIYKANEKYANAVDVNDLNNVKFPINYPDTKVVKIVEELYYDAGYIFANQFIKDYFKGKFKSDLSDGIPKVQWMTDAIAQYLAANINEIRTIDLTSAESVQALINSVVNDAIQEGKGVNEVKKALKTNKFLANLRRTSRFQAERIARTETLSAASHGEFISTQHLFEEYGVTMEKYWIAKKDSRTRNAHNEMKRSESIGANQDFNVGGAPMKYPGDRKGGAKNVINCRCALGWRRIEGPEEE
jgi:hypothetical protein